MKNYLLKTALISLLLCFSVPQLQAQRSVIRRLQEKTEQKIVNEIFGESENNNQNNNSNEQQENADSNNSSSSSVQNRRGSGLEQSSPDVLASITEAKENLDADNYRLAKSSVRNALWGVEIEIGKKVLESLPQTVSGLPRVESDDRVSSTGAGFVGLIIERVYQDNDMQVKATIGNDSALLGIAGIYMAEGMYTQSTDQPNQKNIQFQSHRAVIRFDESDGYTLSVAFGQSSVFLINGVNFESESEFMTAAGSFDIATIKSMLGEQ